MKKNYRNFVVAAAFASILTVVGSNIAGAQEYDLVITGGRVIDPETGLDAIRNVAIQDGRIAAITETPLKSAKTINAEGLIVSPGFIDVHTHSYFMPGQRLQAHDGVTTGLEMESGILPVAAWYDIQAKEGRLINYGVAVSWTYARIIAMTPEMPPVEPNFTWYQKAYNYTNWVTEVSTLEQQNVILSHIQKGLDEGAVGIGVNSGYAPGAGGKELMAVWKLAAKNKVPISTHLREWSMVDPLSSVEGTNTVIGLAMTTGARTNICHVNSTGLGDGARMVEQLTAARARGLDIHAEAYPYGIATLPIASSIVGFDREKFMQRIGVDFNAVRLLAKQRDIKDEPDLRAEQKSDPGQPIILTYLNENDPKHEKILAASVTSPWMGIASDAIPVTMPDGSFLQTDIWPLPKDALSNPRSAGTYSRFLGRWVREKRALDWPQAIAKITLIPAKLFEDMVPQMDRKGRLQVGMDADVTVFDPETIIDHATIDNSVAPSTGVKFLLVNGEMVIENGIMNTKVHPGQPIRRTTTQGK